MHACMAEVQMPDLFSGILVDYEMHYTLVYKLYLALVLPPVVTRRQLCFARQPQLKIILLRETRPPIDYMDRCFAKQEQRIR
jgi:hypothetical protein